MTLTLCINDETEGSGVHPARIEEAVRAALDSGTPEGGPVARAELSLTLVGRDEMRRLNREYHATDRSTDVLAFALDPETGAEGLSILGDLYVCPAEAAASAREHGISPEKETLRLVIHGVLHLLGHDHPEGEGGERYESPMFRIQERLLAALGD